MAKRKYPVGIQTFSDIIRRGCVYVDKTDLVWRLTDDQKFVFLSRPRRFGKSLLSSTLHSYFDGDKSLFEGLKIMELEKEWKQYPVLHLDMSPCKNEATADGLRESLMYYVGQYAETYGKKEDETTPGKLFTGLIKRAYQQTGRQVVVIIDEYDAPLLDSLHEDEVLAAKRRVMQDLYSPLKACDPYIRFCFITGITKFSQLSIFSTINNLLNITMLPQYSAICGITETELTTTLWQDIELLAEHYGCSAEEMHQMLKRKYDGYRFSEDAEEIYNPYSLMTAFLAQKLDNYWFGSGTPTFLIRQMQRFNTDLLRLDNMEASAAEFDRPTEAMTDALPLLYQSGYITIKGYNRATDEYTLAIPNQEVRVGLIYGLLPYYTGLQSSQVQSGFATKFFKALLQRDVNQAMLAMQSYMAGIPYVEGFKQKLSEAAVKEAFYEYTMYLILSMLNVHVSTQVRVATGRIDMVAWMPDTVYVFELKVNGTAADALRQIDEKGYTLPFQADGRKVVKVGVHFDPDTRVPDEWVIDE